jgi:hypothetical protein
VQEVRPLRIFVFVLMVAVGLGGLLGGYRVITGRDLVSLSDFGVGRSSVKTTVLPTRQPEAPTAAPTPVVLQTPVAATTATPSPDQSQTMVVANTDGTGVFLRKTPHMDDKLRAWVEGTKMIVTGAAIQSDGQQWLKVRAPDGSEGYIPQQFLAPAP